MEDPAEQEPWRMAMAGRTREDRRTGTLEDGQDGAGGIDRPALAHQEARGEPAAWQVAMVGPAGREAWVAPAGRGAWEAPAGRGAWEAPAVGGACAAPAG